MSITVIAHRSGPVRYPEQTVASARLAIENGADYVEMDVQLTQDMVPVICHDKNALRIFGVDKLINDMPLNEFKTMRHLVDCSYPSHTLDDVLSLNVGKLLLHCKQSGKELACVAQHIADFHYEDKTIIGIQEVGDVPVIRGVSDQIKILSFMHTVDDFESFLHTDVDIIRLWEDWVTKERVDRVHEMGKQVCIMSGKPKSVGVTTADAVKSWLPLKMDGILINDVTWLFDILKNQ